MASKSPIDFAPFSNLPALDGIRAVAVLSVMVFHLGTFVPEFGPLLGGGFLGVDIFFVLSGFLITCVLINEFSRTSTISLKYFYIRRVFRLVPAFWAYIIVLFLFGRFVLSAGEISATFGGWNVVFALTYLTNWRIALAGPIGHFNHTWSLSIEEQFYLLWPPVLIMLLRSQWGKLRVVAVLGCLIAIIAAFRLWRANNGAAFGELYFTTESRIDSLLTGCLAGFLFMSASIRSRLSESKHFVYLAGLAVVVDAFLLYSARELEIFRWQLLVFEISTAVVILWVSTQPQGLPSRVLSTDSMRFVGRVSYALYLWHPVAYRIAYDFVPDLSVQIPAALTFAFGAAIASYYLIELPFLRLKKSFERN